MLWGNVVCFVDGSSVRVIEIPGKTLTGRKRKSVRWKNSMKPDEHKKTGNAGGMVDLVRDKIGDTYRGGREGIHL